uniref:Uncharacterized protein n=1 Tax=Rhizophora mucronata TaxID=61149 RepID=A0A2P2P7K0_RHIMU
MFSCLNPIYLSLLSISCLICSASSFLALYRTIIIACFQHK